MNTTVTDFLTSNTDNERVSRPDGLNPVTHLANEKGHCMAELDRYANLHINFRMDNTKLDNDILAVLSAEVPNIQEKTYLPEKWYCVGKVRQ